MRNQENPCFSWRLYLVIGKGDAETIMIQEEMRMWEQRTLGFLLSQFQFVPSSYTTNIMCWIQTQSLLFQ